MTNDRAAIAAADRRHLEQLAEVLASHRVAVIEECIERIRGHSMAAEVLKIGCPVDADDLTGLVCSRCGHPPDDHNYRHPFTAARPSDFEPKGPPR